MNPDDTKKLINLYLSHVEMIDEGLPQFIRSARSEALELLNLYGLPDYADMWLGRAAEQYFTTSYPAIRPLPETEDHYSITLINGFYRDPESLRELPCGTVIGSLAAAANTPELGLHEYYNTLARDDKDTAAAINTIFSQDGAFVRIPAGVQLNKPLIIKSLGYSERETAAFFPRLLLIFEPGSKGQVAIEHRTLSGEPLISSPLQEIFIGRGAHAEIIQTAEVNPHSALMLNSYTAQDEQSRCDSLFFGLNGEAARMNVNVFLNGSGAENTTDGLILSGAGEDIELWTNIEHRAEDCTSNEHVKAIAADGGTSTFNGRIYVAPGAQGTQAYQKNNNLLLGDGGHIRTRPQLEIYADNVKCSHGATVGQLDEEAIYYMRQRGISEKEARKLQMHGFINDVIGRCRIKSLCERLGEAAAKKIESL